MDAEGVGNPQQSVKADPLFAPFDLAYVNGVKISLFRQFLLAQASPVAMASDRLPKNSEMWFWPRHDHSEKQEGEQANTPNMGLFPGCDSATGLWESEGHEFRITHGL